MDQERKIRFLYPPFVLIISIVICYYSDKKHNIIDFYKLGDEVDKSLEIILFILGGGILILVLGFLISVISMNILRLAFLLFKHKHYMAADFLNKKSYESIQQKLLNDGDTLEVNDKKLSVIAYENMIMPERLQSWIIRRWNSFNVSFNSFVSLILSVFIALIFDLNFNWRWLLFILTIGFFLLINAIYSWRETLRMSEFYHKCDHNKIKTLTK